MSDKKFNDSELLTDDELEHVAGGFRLANPIDYKPEIPSHIQKLVAQYIRENPSTDGFNNEPRQ